MSIRIRVVVAVVIVAGFSGVAVRALFQTGVPNLGAVLASNVTATVTDTPIPVITFPAITPTAPITPLLHAQWYVDLSNLFWLSPVKSARSIAFAPRAMDVAFTVNSEYNAGEMDLFRVLSDTSGDLTSSINPVTGLYEIGGIDQVESNYAADRYALGVYRTSKDHLQLFPYSDIWLSSPDGSHVKNVTNGDYEIMDFGWVPTGNEVWFITSDGELIVENVSSGITSVIATNLWLLSGSAGTQLSWSEDGNQVAFVTRGEDFHSRLEYVFRPSLTRVEAHDFGDVGVRPVFPEAEQGIVFVVTGGTVAIGPETKLYSVGVSSPYVTQLRATLASGSGQMWVDSIVCDTDSDRMFFLMDKRIYRINYDGSAMTEVFSSETVRGKLTIQRLDEYRRRLAFVVSNYLGVPAGGLATPTIETKTTEFAIRSIDITSY